MAEDGIRHCLVALNRARETRGNDWVPSLELSKMLRDEMGIRMHWRTIDATLCGRLDLVDRRRRQHRWEFFLLAAAEDMVKDNEDQVIVVEPDRALSSVAALHSLLSHLKGTVRICDPYVDASTIEHLQACARESEVRLLSKSLREEGRIRRLLSAAIVEGRSFRIKMASSTVLHDRYIIDDTSMLIIGTSLNGFGKKQCFVTKVDGVLRESMVKGFDEVWDSSIDWS